MLAEARCSVVKDFADGGCCVVVHVLIREIIPKIKHTITKRRIVFTPRPARLSLKFMILPSNLGEDAIFWTAARVLKAEGGNAPCLCGGPRWSGFGRRLTIAFRPALRFDYPLPDLGGRFLVG